MTNILTELSETGDHMHQPAAIVPPPAMLIELSKQLVKDAFSGPQAEPTDAPDQLTMAFQLRNTAIDLGYQEQ